MVRFGLVTAEFTMLKVTTFATIWKKIGILRQLSKKILHQSLPNLQIW